jgi:hypothetical protein
MLQAGIHRLDQRDWTSKGRSGIRAVQGRLASTDEPWQRSRASVGRDDIVFARLCVDATQSRRPWRRIFELFIHRCRANLIAIPIFLSLSLQSGGRLQGD